MQKNGYPFNGSKVDRLFGYSKIDAVLEWDCRQMLAPECQSTPTPTPSFNDLPRSRFDPDDAEQSLQEPLRRRYGRRR